MLWLPHYCGYKWAADIARRDAIPAARTTTCLQAYL